MNTNRRIKAWCGFIYQLRRHGYWGDPEKYREWFKSFYSDYINGIDRDTSVVWYDEHCFDAFELEHDGPTWSNWTDIDQKLADIEYNDCMRKRGKSKKY